MASEETQSVPQPDTEVKIPELSVEIKLQIRNAQVEILTLREQARAAFDRSKLLEQQVASFLNTQAEQMGVDTDKFGFTTATLTFYPLADKGVQ